MEKHRFMRPAALAALVVALTCTGASWAAKPVVILSIEGIIDPVMVRYVERGFKSAEDRGAQCVLIKISTPGGLEQSMREMVQVILNSPVPSIAYVTPKGTRAASAGAFIVLSCNLTAMAPGTTMGAAHPVSGQGKDIGGNLDKKITNDAAAFMRSLATQRGRDPKWSEESVTKSLSVNENEALKLKLIDCIADSVADLLTKLDGRTIKSGRTRVRLDFKGAELVNEETSAREKFFHMLAHPELAYVFMTLGTMGLIFELQSPGLGLAGFVGVVCLVLALISLSIIPFSAGGLALIALGIGLFIAELKVVTHGVLSAIGAVCLVLGSLMLFSPLEPFWHVSKLVILVMTGMVTGFFVFLAWLGVRAQMARVASGRESLIGHEGVVVTAMEPEGIIHVDGEDWTAASPAGRLKKGTRVVVTRADGIKLVVEPSGTGEGGSDRPRPRR
jgi:membrane-bound serine protease (ClpP class)